MSRAFLRHVHVDTRSGGHTFTLTHVQVDIRGHTQRDVDIVGGGADETGRDGLTQGLSLSLALALALSRHL
jgi:hypothetical protein